MGLKLGAVHHVSINVADVEAVAPFYTNILGMRVLDRPNFGFAGRWLRSPGGGELHLVEVKGWIPPIGQHWAFKVDDIDAAVAELRARGVEIDDPKFIPGTTARQTFIQDPAGNMIELNQPS